MDSLVNELITLAALAIGGLLVWRLADGVQKLFADDRTLPFYRMLERRGLTVAQIEQGAGARELAGAVRRCALCSSKNACRADLARSNLRAEPAGTPLDYCPNASLFVRLAR